MSKTTPILLTTHTLSKAVDRLLGAAGAEGGLPSKSRILNILAQTVAGPKHDWGYLTGSRGRVVAEDAKRFAEPEPASAGETYFYRFDERDDWGRDPVGPFASRAALLQALFADPWIARDPLYPASEVVNALATADEFFFYSSDDPRHGDEDASPYSVSVFRARPDAPAAETPGMPIVGYQILDGEDYYEAEDGNHPASFELFVTEEDAQAYIRCIEPPRSGLRVASVRAGDIEHPSWI